MEPKAIIGVVLILIGIVIIGLIAAIVFGVMAHDADNIGDVLGAIDPNSIVFWVIFGIPVITCFLPGYYLIKSD
ncbi:MAG: hypothetical protein ACTSO8_01880 [Promethearchaeota archaeon]